MLHDLYPNEIGSVQAIQEVGSVKKIKRHYKLFSERLAKECNI